MNKFSLKDIFHKPISGEWGNEPTDDYVEIIKTNNILNFGKIDFSNTTLREIDTKKVENKKLEYGDILVEKSGGSPANPVGRVCFFNKNEGIYLTNNFMSTLRLKNSNFDSKYVFYYLFNLYRKKVVLNFQNQTTGIINFKLDRYLNEISIYQIDLNKQKLIAKTLDKANELIELRKESITKLDALAKSIFIDMFGDPVSNPKKWEIDILQNIIEDVKNGISRRGNDDNGSIVLKLKDIRENFVNFKSLNRIKLTEKEEKYIVEANDILFIRVNGNPEYVGRCSVFTKYKEKVYFNDHIMRMKIDVKNFNPYFLTFLLNLPYGKMEIEKYRKTSAGQYTISQDGLNKISLYLPPINLQNKFAKIIEKIEEQKSLYTQELEKLQINFDALLQKSFQ